MDQSNEFENGFWVFSYSEMLQTGRAEKVDEKMGSFVYIPCSLPEFPWSKKWIFCNFVLNSAKNLSILKQLTYMHLKGLVTHFHKMVSLIMPWLNVLEISVWNWRIMLNFYWVSFFFDILIAIISWTVAQTPINHIIIWKTVIRTFRCMYNRHWILPFLLMPSNKTLPQVFIIIPEAEGTVFLNIFFLQWKEGWRGLWNWKNYQN